MSVKSDNYNWLYPNSAPCSKETSLVLRRFGQFQILCHAYKPRYLGSNRQDPGTRKKSNSVSTDYVIRLPEKKAT